MMAGITKANDDDAEAHLCSFCSHIRHSWSQHLDKKTFIRFEISHLENLDILDLKV